jgi:hypothetical protein
LRRPRKIAILPVPAGVRIEIALPHKPLAATHFGIMLALMLVALWATAGGDAATVDDLLSVAFLFLLAAGFLVGLLWNLAAREVVTVDIRRVRVGVEVPFVGRPLGIGRDFNRQGVRNLRYEPSLAAPVPALPFLRRSGYRQAPRNVCFDTGTDTVRFGIDLEEADAASVIAAWTARFPVPRA